MSEELYNPHWGNTFRKPMKTEQELIIESKDQQIKDLTELLDIAEHVIESGSLLDLDNYNSKRESYQQKYPNP